MKSHSIVITDADMDRLSRLVRALKHSLFRDQTRLESLEQTLESAEVTSLERIPGDVIRMNSSIRILDLETRKKESYTLTFPDTADISTSRISVLAPVGTALLGRRQGEVIETKVPGGARRLRIERVSQRPEIIRRQAQSDRSNRRELHSGRTTQRMTLAA
jgi:regulator of nucleoside diphosphate kinase